MRIFPPVFFLLCAMLAFAQPAKVSTLDFVQIQNDNREEAVFYYENNWLILRKMALDSGYITSFEIIEVEASDDAPFHLILKTTYPDKEAFDKSEERFAKLIEEKGPLKLLNGKEPGEFRKILFYKLEGKHLF
ncbi:MAG: hypothetical protein ABJG47_08960 [Ekhidna sp.]